MADYYPPRPWAANLGDIDEQEYRVIRDATGRPLAYVDKMLSANMQEDVARLLKNAPLLLSGVRSVFFKSDMTETERERWRAAMGPVLAELWSVSGDRP